MGILRLRFWMSAAQPGLVDSTDRAANAASMRILDTDLRVMMVSIFSVLIHSTGTQPQAGGWFAYLAHGAPALVPFGRQSVFHREAKTIKRYPPPRRERKAG